MNNEQNYTSERQLPDEEENSKIQSKDALISFIDNIFDQALAKCDLSDEISDKANYLYHPSMIESFRKLCYTGLSWTNLMRPIFKSPHVVGSSSRSESYYKSTKDRIPCPIALQKFMLFDVKRIKAKVKFGFNKLSTLYGDKEKPTASVSFEAYFNQLKIEDSNNTYLSKENLLSYTDRHNELRVLSKDLSTNEPEISQILSSNVGKLNKCFYSEESFSFNFQDSDQVSIPSFNKIQSSSPVKTQANLPTTRKLILYGSNIGFKEYEIDNEKLNICLLNTSSFDSISELITTAYIKSEPFATELDKILKTNLEMTMKFVRNSKNFCEP